MPTVSLIIGFLLIVVLVLVWLELRKARPKPHNPSVFVDMEDQPLTEIDFEAGIRANRKNPRASHAD
jgi:hypothetical protein